jgi:hypothetical protein
MGLLVAWAWGALVKAKNAAFDEKSDWFVCHFVNISIIGDAAQGYLATNGAVGPITLETLVHAKRLPEWSEIYICPKQYGITAPRTNHSELYGPRLFAPSLVAAHYSNGSYFVETVSNSLWIGCRFHTNEVRQLHRSSPENPPIKNTSRSGPIPTDSLFGQTDTQSAARLFNLCSE